MLIECERMHIDTADNVTMASEATFAACPISSLGLMLMLAYRTLATCASFRASEALDASLCAFMGEVVDVLAIFPQGHALVVVTPTVLVTYTMGMTDEEGANVSATAEADHSMSGFMAQITNAAFCSSALLVLGPLQSTPSARTFLAPRLLFGKLAQHLGSLPFERADATACDDHRLARVSRDCCQMDFTQIDCRMDFSRRVLCFGCFDADMQFKAVIPNQAACAAILGQSEMQDDGLAPLAHRQNNASRLLRDRLSRPFDRIEAFLSPWIVHPHLRVRLTELARGVDIGKESMYYHLYRLTVQCKLSAFGSLLQLTLPRPLRMIHPSLLVRFDTEVPDFGGFHLRISKRRRQLFSGLQSVDTDCFHASKLLSIFVFYYTQRSIFE
jgi:hypothetical protein